MSWQIPKESEGPWLPMMNDQLCCILDIRLGRGQIEIKYLVLYYIASLVVVAVVVHQCDHDLKPSKTIFHFVKINIFFFFLHVSFSCLYHKILVFCLFGFWLKIPFNIFFSHVGTEPTLPGFNRYCRELINLSCSRTQRGDACGVRTQDLSIRSQMLYH